MNDKNRKWAWNGQIETKRKTQWKVKWEMK